MNKRAVVQAVLDGGTPPYVPWSMSFTLEAAEKLARYYTPAALEDVLGNHILNLGNGVGFFDEVGPGLVRDVFGVLWDRTIDADIGQVQGQVLPRPTLAGYALPDPLDARCFQDIPGLLAQYGERYRVYSIGFSLYERAWTLRGLEPLMIDFHDHPGFVRDLLRAIADYNIAQLQDAAHYPIDAVYFGDDWGQQRGLQMGPKLWKQFIFPELTRMYAAVKQAGKRVFIHSCGDVDELFDELIAIGLDCFNPFQPEVMDVFALLERYRGRLAFHGGLSTQRTLPYATPDEVRAETRRLLDAGRQGGYIFAPAHAVEGDVPLENMLAMIEVVQGQIGIEMPSTNGAGK